jgi:hypothetical protein
MINPASQPATAPMIRKMIRLCTSMVNSSWVGLMIGKGIGELMFNRANRRSGRPEAVARL